MVNTKTTGRKEGHRCPMCSQRIIDEDSWEKHVIECGRQRRQKRFECKQCDYATNKKSDMQRHERTRHSGRSDHVPAGSDSEWETQDPGTLSDVVGESNAPTPISITSEVTKRKPTRPLPVYAPKAKTIVSPDAVAPVAPGPFVTPMITPRERSAKPLPVSESVSKCTSSMDFTAQVAPTTADAATETSPSRGRDAETQTEVSKKRRLNRVQKTYQVEGQTVIELHEEEEWL